MRGMPNMRQRGWVTWGVPLGVLGALAWLASAWLAAAPLAASGGVAVPSHGAIAAAYGQSPLAFEANWGQSDAAVQYLARGDGYTLFLTPAEAVLALRPPTPEPGDRAARRGLGPEHEAAAPAASAVLRMRLVDAIPNPTMLGQAEQPGRVNYFLGNDPAQWRTDIPTYGRVRYQDVYPGIDLIYYGAQGQLEYDFAVAPGADPGAVGLAFEGAEAVRVNAATGELVLALVGGEVRQWPPRVYQDTEAGRREVTGGYVVRADGRVGFALGAYDAAWPLTIDPVLLYSTYLGGSGDEQGWGIAVDGSGSAYVTGLTRSANFPQANPLPAPNNALRGGQDAFVTKLSAAGNSLVYSTYLGGSGFDQGLGIAVDGSGSAYVTGQTFSADFPLASPLPAPNNALQGDSDAFAAKLSAAGNSLLYSTYLGGNAADEGHGIAVDANGSAYVMGLTQSANFPLANALPAPNNALQGTSDAFVTKLSPAGSSLVYSTYLGGSGGEIGNAIAVDASGSAYVTGWTTSTNFPTASPLPAPNNALQGTQDAFVTKLSAAGSSLVYSTYLGGSGFDQGTSIAVDGSGSAYVTGLTVSANFPLASPLPAPNNALQGGADAFVTKLSAAGNSLVYSTYLGGGGQDFGNAIAVDASGSAYVTGQTQSANFPLASPLPAPNNALQGTQDAFVTKLSAAGSSLVYSTYLGGGGVDSGNDIAVDAGGSAYVTGYTQSANFPLASPLPAPNNALQGTQDAFVAKLALAGPCAPRPNVILTVAPSGVGRLQVTVVAGTAPATPNNLIVALQFGAATNALIDIGGQTSLTGNFNFPVGTPQTTFFVRQPAGGYTTVPLTVVDSCGTWLTFVGGGPSAFLGPDLGPAAPTATLRPAPAATPIASPASGTPVRQAVTPTATATAAPVCAPRPSVSVSSAPSGPGQLQVTVAASAAANVQLQALHFGATTNGTVIVGAQTGPGGFTVTLPPGTQQATFTLARTSAGQSATVPLTVVDSCGDWPTLVGGGPTAF